MRDPGHVRTQYASEENLADRAALYATTTGPFAGDVAFVAVAERPTRRLLDVGCGTGWFGSRVRRELGADVVAVDQSERMVELARADGVDARVADVQSLPFDNGEFDCAAAHWMLYHVADLDLALGEIARVLSPRGRLVAITNGRDHLLELWEAVGGGELRAGRDVSFAAENGAAALGRHFAHVELRDACGTVTIEDRDAVVRYVGSTAAWNNIVVPDRLELPIVARRSNVVFVAEKAPPG
jgi:SAM-dependent methyltransferase